jgi:gluconolactonase
MAQFRVVTRGLKFPEGPVAMPDGTLLVAEIFGGNVMRVQPDGRKDVVAHVGGGPNGIAIGPDGAAYVCNNGGQKWHADGHRYRSIGQPDDYKGGWIERVDLATGKAEVLYRECDGHRLCAPNDIVFDRQGGFWFTDFGKVRPRDIDRGGVYSATTDGRSISCAQHPFQGPNGIALSPDDKTLWVAETDAARLWSYKILGPGKLEKQPFPSPNGGVFVAGSEPYQRFDSMAVEANGNVCIATLVRGGITVVPPDGKNVEFVPLDDLYVTNICFGGADLRKAYVCLSHEGLLIEMDWPRPGLPLWFLNKTP